MTKILEKLTAIIIFTIIMPFILILNLIREVVISILLYPTGVLIITGFDKKTWRTHFENLAKIVHK